MNVENQLTVIQKMLAALLRTSGNLHWVDGYAYGYTSQGDPFIVLYPAGDHLKFQICRVYPHDFRKLPKAIVEGLPDAGPDAPGDKDKAKRQGNYFTCPLMCVVTYDGKETQMGAEKRFSDVLFVKTPATEKETN